MKTKFTAHGTTEVEINYGDVWGDMQKRVFYVSPEGGYVKEYFGDGLKQVCSELRCNGATLYITDIEKTALISVIRREYNARKRSDARDLAKL